MHTVIAFAVLGLGIGGVYGLLGNGLVLIYRGSGLVNFAHGAMAMAAAYTFYELDRVKGWNVGLAFVASVALLGLIGVLTQVILMRRLRDAAPISRLIGTLGVLALLDGLFSKWFGASSNTVLPPILPHGPLHIGGYTIDKQALCLLGIGAVICLALYLWSRFSASGLAITAVAESPDAAATLGWSPQGLATLTWGTGAALAGIAGILIAPTTGLVVTNMTLIVVSAMAAALLGGFESFPVVFAAGVVIGVVQSEMARYVTAPGWSDSLPFIVITIALVVRGRGLPVRGHVLEQLPRLASGVVPVRVVLPLTVLLCVGIETVFSQNLTLALTVQITVAIILLSIVVVTGFAGQLSLAQYALAGVGAFVAGRLSAAQGWPFILCLIAGVLGAAAAGAVVGAPALRTRGVNLAIITLGLAVAVQDLIFLNPNYTGGFGGTTVASPKLFGLSIDPIETPGRYAIFCCLCLLAVTIVVGNVRRSRVGRRLIAVRANENAAASLGVSVTGAKLYAFAFGAGVAGLGGVLLAFQNPVLQFNSFDPLTSVNFVGYATIGGVGHLAGPLYGSGFQNGGLGSLVLSKFGDLDAWLPVIGGVALILVLLQNPDGIAGTPAPKWLKRLAHRRTSVPVRVSEAVAGNAGATFAVPGQAQGSGAAVAGSELGPRARLKVSDLTVRFGGVVAVDAVSLEVAPGEIVGLIGPNGAGKTTFIEAVTGFVAPQAGAVFLGDADLSRVRPYKRARAGVVRTFQSLELFEDFSAWDNFQVAIEPRDRKAYLTGLVHPGRARLSETAEAVIDLFGLKPHLDRFPRDLPYGTRRLLGIARAVACGPNTLLLDEPAAGLDDATTARLASLLRMLAVTSDVGVLLVEHDMNLVMEVCDRIVVMDFGKVICSGAPAEVRADPAVIAAYLGETDASGAVGSEAGAIASGLATHGSRVTEEKR
jgi:ABC-type branched-subunit amino acid transport system ATPase component/ABC-type branched-subunit amino acid transport system permease subunit